MDDYYERKERRNMEMVECWLCALKYASPFVAGLFTAWLLGLI